MVEFRGKTLFVATGPRALPQGAPTSPGITNALCMRLDRRLAGLGRVLMREGIARVEATWGRRPIRIGAQAHLAGFYGSLGFAVSGPAYDEDGIPHVPMVRDA